MERHTALTETHLASGASMMWAGPWKRVEAYNGDVQGEYQAVRERVGLIDVGTLGKFLVAGPTRPSSWSASTRCASPTSRRAACATACCSRRAA